MRIKNAKARLAERSRRRIGEGVTDKTLEDLEEAAMTEQDGEKINELFEE